MYLDKYTELDETIINLAKIKAYSLIGKYGFAKSDLEDIEHELVKAIVEQLPKYDAGQTTMSTFASLAIHQKSIQMILARIAPNKDFRTQLIEMNEHDKDDFNEELIEAVCCLESASTSKTSVLSYLLAIKLGAETAA